MYLIDCMCTTHYSWLLSIWAHLDQRQESTETDKVFPRYYYYSIVLSAATEEILPSYYYYIRKNIARSYHIRRLLFFFSKCLAKNIDIIRKENIKIWRVFLTTFLFFKKWLSSMNLLYYQSWIFVKASFLTVSTFNRSLVQFCLILWRCSPFCLFKTCICFSFVCDVM